MKRPVSTLLLLLLFAGVKAQLLVQPEALSATPWLMDSAMFPANMLKMKAYVAARDSGRLYYSYDFKKGGELEFTRHTTPGIGYCGNGIPYVKKASWVYKSGYIRIKMTGGYLAAGTYDFDIIYKISSIDNGKLTLKRARTYKNKRCENCPNE